MNDYLDLILIEAVENEIPRYIRPRFNAFNLRETRFIKLFRLNKELTTLLIERLREHIRPPGKRWALDVETKVLIALRFFATGGYQTDVGNDINLAVSQSSVSRCVKEVTEIVNTILLPEWVKFPTSEDQLIRNRSAFYTKYNFPGVIGCIDCTHVAIVTPNSLNPDILPHVYINRKGYHSINVQLICDSNMKILNVNARYPGSTHDSFIWRNSNVNNFLSRRYENNNTHFWLLGDAGYPLQPWLMTPVMDARNESPEARFNDAHIRTRITIERCNGVLKNRFRCLLKHRVLHYAPNVASRIINTCVVLHNMCLAYNVEEPNEEIEDFDYGMYNLNALMNEDAYAPNQILDRGRRTRSRIIRTYFD